VGGRSTMGVAVLEKVSGGGVRGRPANCASHAELCAAFSTMRWALVAQPPSCRREGWSLWVGCLLSACIDTPPHVPLAGRAPFCPVCPAVYSGAGGAACRLPCGGAQEPGVAGKPACWFCGCCWLPWLAGCRPASLAGTLFPLALPPSLSCSLGISLLPFLSCSLATSRLQVATFTRDTERLQINLEKIRSEIRWVGGGCWVAGCWVAGQVLGSPGRGAAA
jgi:hypothetical protein